MKTLGLIGGMSWESTLVYYQMLNRIARERLGGSHSAALILWSVDFEPIAAAVASATWINGIDTAACTASAIRCMVLAQISRACAPAASSRWAAPTRT